MLCRDQFSNTHHGDYLSAFMEEIHNKLEYLVGRSKLASVKENPYGVYSTRVSRTDDAFEYLQECSDDHFLDFVEFIFRTSDSWRAKDGVLNPGKSVIVDPDGKIVAGPADGETILHGSFTTEQIVGPHWQLDTAGHYSRPDVFELRVNTSPRPQIEDV